VNEIDRRTLCRFRLPHFIIVVAEEASGVDRVRHIREQSFLSILPKFQKEVTRQSSIMLRFLTRNTTAIAQWGFSNLVTSRPVLFGGIITRGMTKSILKTNKSAAKRFRVSGNGSIRRYAQCDSKRMM
jgi:hypothetical protein